jgi:hypothetical protein
MKKLLLFATIAIFGLFGLQSCEKDMIPQTTQGLNVRFEKNYFTEALIAVGENGISSGPGLDIFFKTYGDVLHITRMDVEFISASKEPITAVSLNVQRNWITGNLANRTVKNKKVTITGDLAILPGEGETSIGIIPAFAGIGPNSIPGSKVEMKVTKIVFYSEKDGRTGEMNPEITFSLGTVTASAGQINLMTWNPYRNSYVRLPNRTGVSTDIAVINPYTYNGSNTYQKVKMSIDLEGMFLPPSKEITIRDNYGGILSKTKVISTSGGEFFVEIPYPIVTPRETYYMPVSVVIDSITPGVQHSITTRIISFEWRDNVAGKEFSTSTFHHLWYQNGYNWLIQSGVTLDN